MNRRKFMIGAGSIGAATLGTVALTGSAAAEARIPDYEFDFDTVKGTSDDGTLDGVIARAKNIKIAWTGLDDAADYAFIALSAGDDKQYVIDHALVEDLSGTTGSQKVSGMLDGDIIEHTDYTTDDFREDDDGKQKKTDVSVTLTAIVFYDGPKPGYFEVRHGDSLEKQIDEAEGAVGANAFVRGDNTTTLRVRMSNRKKNATTGADGDATIES